VNDKKLREKYAQQNVKSESEASLDKLTPDKQIP